MNKENYSFHFKRVCTKVQKNKPYENSQSHLLTFRIGIFEESYGHLFLPTKKLIQGISEQHVKFNSALVRK